jgi:hypothetical protein
MTFKMKTAVVSLLSLVCAIGLCAADAIAELQLRDGRVLHSVVVLKDNATSIDVRSDEGLIQLPKAKLPPEVLQRYPLQAEAAAVEKSEHERVVAEFEKSKLARQEQIKVEEKKRIAQREMATVRNGVRIVSFATVRGGIMTVELKNENDSPMQIDPSLLLARGLDNIVYSGRWVVRTSSGFKATDKTARLDGNATVKILISFTRAKDVSLQDVFWTQDPLNKPPAPVGSSTSATPTSAAQTAGLGHN